MIIALDRLGEYDSPRACQLLSLDVNDLRRRFYGPPASWFQVASERAVPLEYSSSHVCSLLRAVLELCGGRVEPRQHAFDSELTAADNMQLYGRLLDIAGKTEVAFGRFDIKEMHSALVQSKASADGDELSTVQWIDRMKSSLPIGHPDGYLVRYPERQIRSTLISLEYPATGAGGSRERAGKRNTHIFVSCSPYGHAIR